MKHNKKLIISILIVLVFVTLNVILFKNVWYKQYLIFDDVTKENTEVLVTFDRQSYLGTYTNFNSKEFSINNLYDNISETMKKTYDTLDKFEMYYEEKIGNKFTDQQYYSIMQYSSEEKLDGYTKVKYTIYYYDLETYITMLDTEKVETGYAKFFIDVYLIEKSIEDYSIEI